MPTKDLRPELLDVLAWDSHDPVKSLQNVRVAVETEAQKAVDWYWGKKSGKRLASRLVQCLALLLTAAAGIVPVVVMIMKSSGRATGFDSGPLATLFVGLAAALIGLDKAFGFSTGWTRFVLTATLITKQLHEFRIDWVAASAAAANPPTLEQQTAMLQRAKEFVSGVQGMVLQETKDWATEFQSNMAQIEKDVRAQLDLLRTQVDKAEKERQGATVPAAIELTVSNADKTDNFGFDIVLEGKDSRKSDHVSRAKVWTAIDLVPGQYRLIANGLVKGAITQTSTVIQLKPGETSKPSLEFTIA